LVDTEHVTNQLERDIHGITSNEQKWITQDFSIHLIKLEAWLETIGIQLLWNTIQQRVIHFGYPTMHVVSHVLESIDGMGTGDNFTTDISERLHIATVREAYLSSNEVNYIQLIPSYNDRCTSLDCI
jgi:hypothetical protein